MRVQQLQWNAESGWRMDDPSLETADLVLYFGSPEYLSFKSGMPLVSLRQSFPDAHLVGLLNGRRDLRPRRVRWHHCRCCHGFRQNKNQSGNSSEFIRLFFFRHGTSLGISP